MARSTDANVSDKDSTSEDALKSRFTFLKSGPTNPALKAVYAAAKLLGDEYLGAYRFNKPSPEANDAVARENRVKEVMHRYMCRYFDGEISVGRYEGASRVEKTLSDIDLDGNVYDQEQKQIDAFTDALTKAYEDPSLDILSGEASGNNTFGQVLGIYDTKKNEVLFFGFTNCGSDN